MKRVLFLKICLALVAAAWPVQGAEFKFASQTLTVPDGFEVELVAGPPMVLRPISASFDDLGRLYVTDSSGSNDKVQKQLEERPHRVLRLEDTNGDGRFNSKVFADRMMFPEGCLWFEGSLYVSAPPSIWKLTDTDNDGIADQREEWHQGKTLTGCANDLHGPYLGLDGLIYWCKGAFAQQTYQWPGKKPFTTRASHIFRARADHSDMEPVLTGGMDNPVGVAFTPGGERILCGTFFIHPEAGKRDGLIHAIYGGVYGKINDVNDDHKKTGDLMPIMTHLGAAAPCSVISYDSAVFGEQYRHNLFVCCFNMHKVTRHMLEPDGATFKTTDTDFVISDSTDFHPTDVIEDADGSLLVVDTGGWYKLCCPTSQLSKPDILGAIYRIRRVGAPRPNDPRGLNLAWNRLSAGEMVKLLGDERPAVRKRAMRELAKHGSDAVTPIAQSLNAETSVDARRNAVWTLTRINSAAAREAVRKALNDQDASVVHAAAASVSLWRDADARDWLVSALHSGNASLERIATEALGRIGDKRSVPALLAASAHENDRVLEHSLTYALIEIDDAAGTAKGLPAENPHEQSVALIALDQMDGGNLKPENVVPLLRSADPHLRQTAKWLVGHHAEWGGVLAGYFREQLSGRVEGSAHAEDLENQLAQFGGSRPIQELVASSLNDPKTPEATREVLLESIGRTTLKESPDGWVPGVEAALKGNEKLLGPALSAARSLSQVKTNSPDFAEALLHIGHENTCPADLRLEALACLRNGLTSVEPGLFEFLCANVDPAKPVTTKNAAATVLAKAKLTDDQLLKLAEVMKTVGPLEMLKLLSAFEHSSSEDVGLHLIESLKSSKSRATLRSDAVKALVAKYPETVQRAGQELLASLDVDTAKQSVQLDEILTSLKPGDIRRGQALFNSPKTLCASCHTMGYLGGRVGPDLTTIGQVRTERDLLESIVYPSASFVRSYEPFVVKTKSDEEYNGVLRKDAPDEVVLATGPGTEVRIARADIAEIRPGTVSVMPAGLADQLSRQELSDLVAFLKATKWGAN